MSNFDHFIKVGIGYKSRAHLDRLRERRAQLRHRAAHGLPADDQVIVAPRDHAHEAVGATPASSRGRWPRTGSCAMMQSSPPVLASSGRLADDHHFRVGEADGGDGGRSRSARLWPAMISATISPCAMARCASIGSPVEVADGPDVAHRGAAVVVDLDRAAVPCPAAALRGPSPRCAACGRRPPAPGRPAARTRRPLALRTRTAVAAVGRGLARCAQVQLHAEAACSVASTGWVSSAS